MKHSGCKSKRRFADRASAEQAIKERKLKFKLYVYPCGDHWHLTKSRQSRPHNGREQASGEEAAKPLPPANAPTVPEPGKYHELLQFVNQQVKPAGALLFVINGIYGTGWECMGSPEIIADLPTLFRKVADDIDRTAGVRTVATARS